MRPLAPLLAVALAGAAGPALAGPSLTLNGVPIDGITSQRFENCTVTIDERGNVHLEAKGYAVRAVGTTGATPTPATTTVSATPRPAAEPAGRLTHRYFLATDHAPPGTQYDLAIFINAQWIREVKASEPQVVMEVTRYLRPGRNKLVVAATKKVEGERLSSSKDVALRVVLGEGDAGGDHVMIDQVLVEARRTAAEIEDRTDEYVFEAR
jgi:hypothetical protein